MNIPPCAFELHRKPSDGKRETGVDQDASSEGSKSGDHLARPAAVLTRMPEANEGAKPLAEAA